MNSQQNVFSIILVLGARLQAIFLFLVNAVLADFVYTSGMQRDQILRKRFLIAGVSALLS
jgi:hypothetical protein